MVESVSRFASDQKLSDYVGAASFTLIIYEAFLTLPLEVTYAWKKNVNLVSVLHLVNRYIMMVFAFALFITSGLYEIKWTHKRCSTMIIINVVNHAIITVCASWILALSAIAVLGNRGHIKLSIYGSLLITHITSMVLSCVYLIPSFANAESLINTKLCAVDASLSSSSKLLYVYLPEAIFFTLAASIILWKTISFRWHFGSASSLITNLIRDGILSFFALAGIRIINCVRFVYRPPSLIDLAVMDIFGTILVGRLVLSLREGANQTSKDPFKTAFGTYRSEWDRPPHETFGGGTPLEAEDSPVGWPPTRLKMFRRLKEDDSC